MAEGNEHLLMYLLVICILFWEISTELLSSHIFLDFIFWFVIIVQKHGLHRCCPRTSSILSAASRV